MRDNPEDRARRSIPGRGHGRGRSPGAEHTKHAFGMAAGFSRAAAESARRTQWEMVHRVVGTELGSLGRVWFDL